MPENLYPADESSAQGGDDAPASRYELRVALSNGGVDEIGAGNSAHLGGYLRALANHGLITPAEHHRQVDALQVQILQHLPPLVTIPTRTK